MDIFQSRYSPAPHLYPLSLIDIQNYQTPAGACFCLVCCNVSLYFLLTFPFHFTKMGYPAFRLLSREVQSVQAAEAPVSMIVHRRVLITEGYVDRQYVLLQKHVLNIRVKIFPRLLPHLRGKELPIA